MLYYRGVAFGHSGRVMNRSTLATIALLAATTMGCGDKTIAPAQGGALDSKIIQGEAQKTTAGKPVPVAAIDQVFRPKIVSAAAARGGLWQRILLPAVAYAQGVVDVLVQPNSPVCQKQPTGMLIAEVPCVTSDAQGHALFSFATVTKAGTHIAVFQATYGTESTAPDTVTVEVLPDSVLSTYKTGVQPFACSGTAFLADGVRDQYGNGVPYHIVSDGRVAVQDTVNGSIGARTLSFTIDLVERDGAGHILSRELELRGANNALVGTMRYAILPGGTGGCPGANTPIIDWSAKGVNAVSY